MYSYLLVLGVALVILSPLALEFWLTAVESRRQRLQEKHFAALTHPRAQGVPLIPARW